MARRVLLVGMNSFDSGKTQVASRLSTALSDEGVSVEYFKPISGHNYWFNHEHTKTCIENGILVSKDVLEVRKLLKTRVPVELSNPVHSLFVPMRLEKPMQNLTNTLGLAGSSSILTMERLSRPSKSGIETTVLVAQNLVDDNLLIIAEEEIRRLTRGASVLSVKNLEDVQEFEQLHFEHYVSESFSQIEKHTDFVIIEGFNDAAWLWDGLEHVDTVLLISPAHIFSYDPERFRKAVYLMNRGNLPIRDVTFGRIADLIKPIRHLQFKPDSDFSDEDLEHLGIEFRTGKND
jgi:predicted P-loop ATPase/GTPase